MAIVLDIHCGGSTAGPNDQTIPDNIPHHWLVFADDIPVVAGIEHELHRYPQPHLGRSTNGNRGCISSRRDA